MKRILLLGLAAAALSNSLLLAQVSIPLNPSILPLGGASFQGWTDVASGNDGATLKVPGNDAVFTYQKGPLGWHIVGFRKENDGTCDWRSYYGLQMDVWVPKDRTLRLKTTAFTPPAKYPEANQDFLPESHSEFTVESSDQDGWHVVTVPLSSFAVGEERFAFWKYIQGVRLGGIFTDGMPDGEIRIKNVRLIKAPTVLIEVPVRSRAGQAGQQIRYDVIVTNTSASPQEVTLRFEANEYDVMTPKVEPSHVKLLPGASAPCVVSVSVPGDGVPLGGHETQKLLAFGNSGTPLQTTEFITSRDVERPSILHTRERWDDIRMKVEKYPWAQAEQQKIVKMADEWQVPDAAVPPNNFSKTEGHSFVFHTAEFSKLQNAAVAWQLTYDKKYAEKVALFLRRLADPKTGYPSTFAGVSDGGPQEGGAFQNVAIAYDAILDASVLSETDKIALEHTFRLFMETWEPDMTVGNIGNWWVATSTACLMLSLDLGDLERADRYIHGPCGWMAFISKGVMEDGWWWECSTGYNLWVASELTQGALSLQPWGIDLVHLEVSANYSPATMIMPWGLNPPYGVSFQKWGPNHQNTRSLKLFWDAIPKMADYRGIAFGMNDGHEEKVGGQRLELAYFVFRDPAYATCIKQTGQRDLLYGVPELPAATPKLYLNSGYSENIGYALLRSQTDGREPSAQIQSVLKIGSQGGFHGHFDRVSLNNITRYGRSFWQPESIWWGYANFMYKMYVQTSVSNNMVVVDGKQQEAVPSTQLLFHSGKMMQVAVQETNARWSDPPYGGLRYGESFAQTMKNNRQSIPLVSDRQYGELGPMSDRVLQRRAEIVTDDYIVLADYLKGEKKHRFDDLFQMKALQSLEAPNKALLRHEAQYDDDPHSSGQFITDADWYGVRAPAIAKFEFRYSPGSDNSGTTEYFNEPGLLKIDVHSLWPQQQEIMVAMPPESHGNEQWVTYSVTGDGKELAKGESGVWILGQMEINVPVDGVKDLTLAISSDGKSKKSALFLANARLVTAEGSELPLVDLPAVNVSEPPKPGQDYYGGPIKIGGMPYELAIAAQPADATKPALLRIPLAGRNAVRFKATLGGDYPFGSESQRRKVYAIRSEGTEGRFLTVLEPYEDKSLIKSAIATSPDTLRIELTDGRVQDISIKNLTGNGKDLSVDITETKDGKIVRNETTTAAMVNP